ncbi:Eukaryotic Translation Initiation Factor 3 Subunit M [Manis pentadactyla]|nr:Eukaryotic Translation Initiation Factor 3 Subunit M [Manis pentadactyla]
MMKEENQNVNSIMNHLDKLQLYLQSHQLNMPDEEIVMMENTCWIKTRNESCLWLFKHIKPQQEQRLKMRERVNFGPDPVFSVQCSKRQCWILL